MSPNQTDDFEQEEVEIEAIGIEVSSQPIELYKVFKIANLVNGGGEAKHIISEGYVAVNGEIETRKRRKIVDGDLIEFNQEYYVVICDLAEGELPEVYEDDLNSEEYLVSAEEAEAINRQLEQKGDEQQGHAEVIDDSEATTDTEESEVEKKKDNGRKSIQFF